MEKLNYDVIHVRYGELSTKGKNIKDFTNRLTTNIKNRLRDFDKLKYHTMHDGLFIELNGEDYDLIKESLLDVFGYSSFSGSIKTNLDIEEIKEKALRLIQKNDYKTFKIVTKRSNKQFPLRSDDINREVAGHILRNHDIKVDVHNPEIKILITIKDQFAYISDEKIIGNGGYPTGVNGKALVMLSGGIDSPVCAYLTQKRGVKVEAIHFASPPYTSKQARDKVLELARKLSYYQEDIIVHIVPFTNLQLEIYKNAKESYCVTLMRRMMYRIADRLAKDRKINIITSGDSLGQVASQTPESMSIINSVCDTLVLRPLCMMDKLEIIDIAKKIDTYETSILPYQDCCTIFDPKNPVTKPKEDECIYYESKFNYEELIDECIKNIETIKVSYRNKEVNDESIF